MSDIRTEIQGYMIHHIELDGERIQRLRPNQFRQLIENRGDHVVVVYLKTGEAIRYGKTLRSFMVGEYDET